MLTCYFGYFRHASQTPPKTIVATWRKLWYLSTPKRSTSPFTSFLRHYEPGFCQIRGLQWSKSTYVIFHIRLISGQANDKIFQKMQKMPFWAHFRPALSNFRQKKFSLKFCSYLPFYSTFPCTKFQKRLTSRFQAILVLDGQTHIQTSMNLQVLSR